MTACLSDDILADFAAGSGSADRLAEWSAHLAGCDACAARLTRRQHDPRAGRAEKAEPASDTDATVTLKPAGAPNLDAASGATPVEAIPGYKILKELHRGGQGVVYQAVQRTTKRKVALKVMLEGPFAGPESKRRFEREIALVGSLRHANIVPIFDSGVAAGRFYYAMEYIRGEPLSQYVQKHKLSVDDTLRLFQKVCAAVDYAHQKGVIHRDLKPSNILADVSDGE